jgi:serine protease Do
MSKKYLIVSLIAILTLSACDPHDVRIANRVQQSTVKIVVKIHKENRKGEILCSGEVVSPTEILTAGHCLSFSKGVEIDHIWIRNWAGRSQTAQIEDVDMLNDLGVLEVRKPEIPARIARKQPSIGATVWVVGMPLGAEFVVSKGIVSQENMKFVGFLASFFITDATVLPGNSGGGAFNDRGELIGIVSMSTSMLGDLGAAGLGIVVDSATLHNYLYN